MAEPPAAPMDITLTVSAFNRATIVQTLPVVSPSVVTIEPSILPAGVPTEVTITVMENDGLTPIPDVEIQLTDAMTYGSSATTDLYGQASLMVDYPYGTVLEVVGTHITSGFLFDDGVTVTAAPLDSPDLTVLTDLVTEGVFVLNLPSTLSAVTGTPEVAVRANVPGTGFVESATGVLDITPTAAGEVTAWILKEGFDLYSEVFPIATEPSAHGTVTLNGEADHSGVLVTAEPGGYSTVTGVDGTWHLMNLEAGTYQITAAKEGWSSGYAEITVADGDHLTGLDFELSVVYAANGCLQANLAIPDPPDSEVNSVQTFVEGGTIDWVRVYLDVSHDWIGNLEIELTSPEGTTVLLHDQSGGHTSDIVGWYPDGLTPASNLNAFIGEDIFGDWTLTLRDLAYGMTGVLNQWCLEIGYAPSTSSAEDRDLPRQLVLEANYPNPFNPTTTIAFALPKTSQVQLRVYDLSGKLVKTLAEETMPAGQHQVIWTGRDDNGRQAASGMYFYRLVAESQTLVGKMLMLK
jgi:subtilisin-like proprotein convertase family protein